MMPSIGGWTTLHLLPTLLFFFGYISHHLVGEETVALMTSRGYETEDHKQYMRGTVLILDMLIYIPVILILSNRLCFNPKVLYLVLTQPALLLIDHGHFQYNGVCLAFALLSFHYFTLDGYIGWNSIIGCIFFCLALNWKQMALYYAPAVFAYLLGRCFSSSLSTNDRLSKLASITSLSKRVGTLGCAVLMTFGVLWYPFYHYGDGVESLFHIIQRIFPFHRGLFEGKVANIWCVLSLKPVSIQDRVSSFLLPKLSLALTFAMMLPFCILLFCTGKKGMVSVSKETQKQLQQRHLKALLWGSAGTSIAFFLASFQVHEKSILLPLAPLSLLILEAPRFIIWFTFASTWSLWHLLSVDQLRLPYFLISFIFYLAYDQFASDIVYGNKQANEEESKKMQTFSMMRFLEETVLCRMVVPISYIGMIALHAMECMITPPSHLPDIFQVLWTIAGCGMNCITWLTIALRLKSEYDFIFSKH